ARLEFGVEIFVEQIRRLHDVHVAIDKAVALFHPTSPSSFCRHGAPASFGVQAVHESSFRGAAPPRARNPYSRGPCSWIPGLTFGDPGMTGEGEPQNVTTERIASPDLWAANPSLISGSVICRVII